MDAENISTSQEVREKRMANRYQNQPLYIRIWRRRHKLLVPYEALCIWWWNRENKEEPLSWRNCWSIANGAADMKMEYWYTSEEVFGEEDWAEWGKKRDDLIVHLCDWAVQPDIRIACTGVMTTPAWGEHQFAEDHVYLADNEDLYTFDERLVTCPNCPKPTV
jgi:hypothetical protein